MKVRVIIPWRGGCPFREAALEWVLRRWRDTHPAWPVTLAELPDGPWIKANAVNPAVAAAREDYVIVADSDVWSDYVPAAVEALARKNWSMPHRPVFRLTQAATAQVLAGADLTDFGRHRGLTERPYFGAPAGGMLCARRQTLIEIPMDPRFVGWGGEDYSLGDALSTLAGRPARADRPLWHLWHPPQERLSRRVGTRENQELRRRYLSAFNHPERMKALVSEFTDQRPQAPHLPS